MLPSKEWYKKYKYILGSITIIFGIVGSIVYAIIQPDPLKSLGIVGLGTFLSVLTGTFFFTEKNDLREGEFRKAITISVISVYFFTLAYGNDIIPLNQTITASSSGYLVNISGGTVVNLVNGTTVTLVNNTVGTLVNGTVSTGNVSTQASILAGLYNNFWAIVLVVIGAYFADRAYSEKK
ncbi:hypothetical protein [Methanobacterium sp. SMA-27]|uniref:hypothetical protein n=1 Tax=Methanobacterium sp. SMA-27 TaxID=1495336 RepID=UPI00064F61C0|nr:hypothetical protein [Methanobacterium sp. SMA-27]